MSDNDEVTCDEAREAISEWCVEHDLLLHRFIDQAERWKAERDKFIEASDELVSRATMLSAESAKLRAECAAAIAKLCAERAAAFKPERQSGE